MDNVTLSTAQRLTASNFPIPPLKSGQMWYCVGDEDKKLIGVELCCFFEDDENSFFVSLETGVVVFLKDVFFKYYAATPSDILLELPDKVLFWKVGNIFVCGVQMESKEGRGVIEFEAIFKHINPAEACALAYLDK